MLQQLLCAPVHPLTWRGVGPAFSSPVTCVCFLGDDFAEGFLLDPKVTRCPSSPRIFCISAGLNITSQSRRLLLRRLPVAVLRRHISWEVTWYYVVRREIQNMGSVSPVVIVVTLAVRPLAYRSPINCHICRQHGRARVGTPPHMRLSAGNLAHPFATTMALIWR